MGISTLAPRCSKAFQRQMLHRSGSKPTTPRSVLPWPPPGGAPGAARRNSAMIGGLQLPRMGGGPGRRASAAGMGLSAIAMARRGGDQNLDQAGVA